MATAEVLTAAERLAVIDRRLDEVDRALLGLLPRAERLAVVASVEARLQALGEDLPVASIAREAAVELPGAAAGSRSRHGGTRRSRLAFTAGVLGIITVAALVISPILFLGLTLVAEVVGETAAIALMGMFTALLLFGGGYAVCGGGASLFRLSGRGQTTTGTGWAITGLCTGALPMLIGFVALLMLGGQVVESQAVSVTWNASPGEPVQGQIHAQQVEYMQAPIMPGPYGASPPVSYGAMLPCNMPTQLPPPLPPDARTASQPQMMAPAKPAPAAKSVPAVEPESGLLPAAPPAKEDDVEAED